jgi:hypothetical protein
MRPNVSQHALRSQSSHPSDPEPLVVRPATAWAMLECGHSHLYDLIATGELDSFLDGAARKITVASIKAYIARQLAKSGKVRESPAKPFKDRRPAKKRAKKVAP